MEFPPTITEAAAAIRAGKLTSVALVEQCLARIDRYDKEIHAWVAVDYDRARMYAHQADAELKSGRDRGPLHGIPIGVKDIIDVKGLPTRCGSPATSPDPRNSDAKVVANLRESGAIILGKTVTCEWASFDPSPTHNPWNPERSPGGSSSGSAAAVATGMCLGAIGTQTGGSITRPAAFCGVCGFKPTFGSIAIDGVQPLSPSLDHVGAMARSIEDAWIVLNFMRDAANQSSAIPSTSTQHKMPRLATIDSPTGFVRRTVAAEVASVFHNAIEKLQLAGVTTSHKEICHSLEDAIEDHKTIMYVEGYGVHKGIALARGPRITNLLFEGQQATAGDVLRARAGKQAFMKSADATASEGCVLLMPTVATTAPRLETTGDSRFQALWSLAGLPAATIPCGLSADGLPVGMQLIGQRNGECELYEAAAWCENAIGFHERPTLE